jgi:hypothetical protein
MRTGIAFTPDLRYLATALRWPPSEEGKLVLLRPYYRHAIWDGVRFLAKIPVVSDIQLALDLWHYPVRGIEQAEVILARVYPWLAAG